MRALPCLLLFLAACSSSSPPTKRAFPETFLWGSATSSFQTEGNITNDDWAVWETLPGAIEGGDKMGRADDHYTYFDDDLAKAQAMGHNAYRFSIEWARIEPEQGKFDDAEIAHYRAVLASCKAHGLKPVVTLEHFSLPVWALNPKAGATSLGGWTNHAVADEFVAYVQKVAGSFVDDVDFWITLNEPMPQLSSGYFTGEWPPGKNLAFVQGIAAFKNMVDAHARAYDAIHSIYAAAGKPVTVTIASHYAAMDPQTPGADDAAAMNLDYLLNLVFLEAVVKGDLDTNLEGAIEHHPEYEHKLDVLGVNYYRRLLIQSMNIGPIKGLPNDDASAMYHGDNGWGVYPDGMTRALHALWDKYALPIVITENGMADATDHLRPYYLVTHLQKVQEAIAAGIDIRGYLHWSLMDNFELASGFKYRFGLMAVDYASPTLTRTPRRSAEAYTAIIKAGGVTPAITKEYGASPQ